MKIVWKPKLAPYFSLPVSGGALFMAVTKPLNASHGFGGTRSKLEEYLSKQMIVVIATFNIAVIIDSKWVLRFEKSK